MLAHAVSWSNNYWRLKIGNTERLGCVSRKFFLQRKLKEAKYSGKDINLEFFVIFSVTNDKNINYNSDYRHEEDM